jgi:hypothetical protein
MLSSADCDRLHASLSDTLNTFTEVIGHVGNSHDNPEMWEIASLLTQAQAQLMRMSGRRLTQNGKAVE